jgi:hypothetical protein
VIIEELPKQEASVAALTYHAPSVAERRGTTAEELRGVLERVPGVVL